MLLDLGEYETEKGASTETKRRFEELEWLAREAMRGIRETVYDLQEVEGQTASLVPQLRTHLAHTAHRAHGLALELQVGRNWPTSLPNDLARAVFAIVTQAVSNVRLHSGAHRAVVRLSFEPPDVIAEIQDDGVGLGSFGRTVEGGVGLRSMRQRARAAGGSFSIRRRPRGGTVIRAQLPLRPPE